MLTAGLRLRCRPPHHTTELDVADNIYLNLPIFRNVHTDCVGKTSMQLHLLEKQNDLLVCSNLPYFSFLSPGPLKGHYPQVG